MLARFLGGTAFSKITAKRTALVRGRTALVRIACSRRGPGCAGRFDITSSRRGRTVRYGGAGFDLAPGARRRVRVRLARTALRRLRASGGRRLSARVTFGNPPAPLRVQRIRLVRPG